MKLLNIFKIIIILCKYIILFFDKIYHINTNCGLLIIHNEII